MTFAVSIGSNIRKSPYFDATVADGVRSFSVYNHMYIPGNFGDPDAEYDRLIHGVCMWDVAAQRQVEIQGPQAEELAQYLTTRDLSKTTVGQGRYVPVCDHDGILINDPVLLKLSEDRYWMSIADSDIQLWAKAIARERGLNVAVFEPDVSPLAIQGPKALNVVRDLFGDWVADLRYFMFRETHLMGIPLVIARSGWSKQGGFELYLMDQTRGADLWSIVKSAGQPHGIGPGAPNDAERIESGLLSFGADCRFQTYPANPFEVGLGALVSTDSGIDFVGRDALIKIQKDGIKRHRVGIIIDGDTIAQNQHPITLFQNETPIGYASEVIYSPRLQKNIGIALVDIGITPESKDLSIWIDGDHHTLSTTSLPFIS